MNTTIRTRLHAAILCVLGTAALDTLTTSAGAAEQDPPTKTVRFNDLDISTPAGAKVLYRRIQAAAREVCQQPMSTDLHLVGAERVCRDKAIDNAVRSVNAAALTQLRFGSELRVARQ
jgi:UrcA family protein